MLPLGRRRRLRGVRHRERLDAEILARIPPLPLRRRLAVPGLRERSAVESAGQVLGPAGAGVSGSLGRRAGVAAAGEAGAPARGNLRRGSGGGVAGGAPGGTGGLRKNVGREDLL